MWLLSSVIIKSSNWKPPRWSFLRRRSFWRRISWGRRLYFDLKKWRKNKIINRIPQLIQLSDENIYLVLSTLRSLSKIIWLTGCCKRPLPKAEGPLWDKLVGKFKFLGGVSLREEISGGSWSFFVAADSTSTWKIGLRTLN